MVWAVSQAAPLRRIHVKVSLRLFDIGWSSGGFMSDSKIDGAVITGSQQQWFTRNSQWLGEWQPGNWNMVFLGNDASSPAPDASYQSPPPGAWTHWPYTTIAKTPIERGKPFLFYHDAKWAVMVPSKQKDFSGLDWDQSGTEVPLSDFYIAHPGDTAETINNALDSGKNLILTPGVYHLDQSIKVTKSDTIVLGIGFPTLVPDSGSADIEISDVDGVKLAGVLFDAGPQNSSTLLQVGASNSSVSHANDPTFLYDVFCRVGGDRVGQATTCVTINSHDVVGDDFWLWRADHGADASWNGNKAAHGLIVNIEAPKADDILFHNMITVWLNGNSDGSQSGIQSILNGSGAPAVSSVGKGNAKSALGSS